MKIVHINTFSNKSTGTIMMNIHNELTRQGEESYVVWGRGREEKKEHEIYMNDKLGVYFHGIYTRLTDKTGFASTRATKKLIKKLELINPDIIHLHNLHGYYINLELLFNYIKENNVKVIWTFHDCWPFTGHCPHFEYVGCEKWKTECHKCPQLSRYPKSFMDNSNWNYLKKKELFTGLDITIVTPSNWLSLLVKKSFLKDYPVLVINNGINTEIFKPRKSDFRKKYNLENKKVILGVASDWTERKGLNDFINLSKVISEDEVIVLVGLSDKQLKQLPNNMIGIKRTESQVELAEIYSDADIFFNPTYEDNYPTVNLEAISCGTFVATYNTGGATEMINSDNGVVTTFDDFCKNYKNYLKLKSLVNSFYDNKNMINEYINAYKKMIDKVE